MMSSEQYKVEVSQENTEITLREFIITIKEWVVYLWKKKLLIIFVGILGAGIGLAYAYTRKPGYLAELTFVVEDNKNNPLGAYGGLASQLGINLGGAGGSFGVFSGDNIMELLRSRLLVERALLLGTTSINGKEVTLAELYIEFNELRKQWKDKPDLQTLHFPVSAERKKFSLQQDSILNIIQSTITKKNLVIEKPEKRLSFISVTCVTINEDFSKKFTEKLVDVALDLYVNTKTQRNKINIDRLQGQADSLEILLNRKTYSAAVAQDINVNPAKQIAGVNVELAMRDKLVLQTMYGEIIKNLELSKLTMEQESPIIQIIDIPILPLEKKKLGKLKGLMLGGILAGFLICVFLIIKKIYTEIMG